MHINSIGIYCQRICIFYKKIRYNKIVGNILRFRNFFTDTLDGLKYIVYNEEDKE